VAEPVDILWQGLLRSASKGREGRPYAILVYRDGTGSCACMDFQMNLKRVGNTYLCKHIKEVIATKGLRFDGGAAAKAPVGTTPPKGTEPTPQARFRVRIGLEANEIERPHPRSSRDWDNYEV